MPDGDGCVELGRTSSIFEATAAWVSSQPTLTGSRTTVGVTRPTGTRG